MTNQLINVCISRLFLLVWLVAICTKPKTSELNLESSDLLPVRVLCDNIRDAGEMGAIIRSAAAANCQQVLISTGWGISVSCTRTIKFGEIFRLM